jgi:hypothetical protein
LGLTACSGLVPDEGATAQGVQPVSERYRANATSVDRGSATIVDITIREWTSPEERQALIEAFVEGGNRGIYDFLAGRKEKGYLQISGSLAYDMRYAYQFEADGKRQVVLATDRSIHLGELRRNSRSLDYSISLVILEIDNATGEGSGMLAIGAELSVDKETGKIQIEVPGIQPTRLTRVRVLRE